LTCRQADKSTAPLKDLQAETVKYVRARHYDAEASESNTTAFYTHDVVTGPLSGAKGKEEVHIHEGREIAVNVGKRETYDSIEAELARKLRPTESEEDVRSGVHLFHHVYVDLIAGKS
jgi:hypothetical protein